MKTNKLAKISISSLIVFLMSSSFVFANAVQKKVDSVFLVVVNYVLIFVKPTASIGVIGIVIYLMVNNDETGVKRAKIAGLILLAAAIIALTVQPVIDDIINAAK